MNLSLSSPVSRSTKLRSTLAFVSAASILLGSLSLASAQAAPPAPQPAAATVEPASASTTSPAPVAPTLIVDQPAPAVEPAPVLKPPAPLASTTPAPNTPRVSVRPYGILWSSVIATQPVQSYGQPNASAPTSALNPAIYAHPHDGLLSFQVQQTRVGLAVGEGSPFKGTLEIDFIHFDQASPLAQAYPRIRIALLEWSFRENQKVFAGQTWDLFGDATGPQLLSHSFNLVGTLFQAGNIGFMRQQVGWSGRFGNIELSAAAGLQGANTGPTFNNIEEAAVPTFAGRVMYHLPGALGVVGVSGIGTSLRFTQGTNIEHRGAGGGQLFADITVGPLNLHSEIYATQNLANTGALNLAQGRYGKNMSDAGGYLSGKLTFGKHAVTAMYGVAMVLNPSNLAPGYTPAGMTGMTVVPAVTNTAAGPGMRWNTTAHVGYWYSPVKGLSIVAEPYVYATRFKLAATDVGNVESKNVAWGGMAGAMYQF